MFDWYVKYEYWLAASQLFFAMLGMGATMTLRDFRDVARSPRAFSIGSVMQLVLVPLIALLFLRARGIEGALAIGIAICAAIPGGTMSNIFTLLVRGNVALSISLTSVTTLACLVTTPIILAILIQQYLPANFQMPAQAIATEIGLYLLLPLMLGMIIYKISREFSLKFSVICIRMSLLVIALIVIGSLGSGRINLQAFGINNILLVVGFVFLLTCAGWFIPRLLNLNTSDTRAIGMEITVRNTNLGLLIKALLFPAVAGQADPWGDTILFTILLYGGLMLIVSGALIFLHRQKERTAIA